MTQSTTSNIEVRPFVMQLFAKDIFIDTVIDENLDYGFTAKYTDIRKSNLHVLILNSGRLESGLPLLGRRCIVES